MMNDNKRREIIEEMIRRVELTQEEYAILANAMYDTSREDTNVTNSIRVILEMIAVAAHDCIV